MEMTIPLSGSVRINELAEGKYQAPSRLSVKRANLGLVLLSLLLKEKIVVTLLETKRDIRRVNQISLQKKNLNLIGITISKSNVEISN